MNITEENADVRTVTEALVAYGVDCEDDLHQLSEEDLIEEVGLKPEQAKQIYKALNSSMPTFDEIDANGDGMIDEQEWHAAFSTSQVGRPIP